MTEPLRDSQLAAIGWRNRQGIGDSANQFHYYRLTADNRILFGGYDAVYHFGKKISPSLDHRAETFDLLGGPLRRDVPAARRARLHARLGWCDRRVQPVLRVLRDGARRADGVRHRLHRARRRARRGSAPT